MRESPALDVMGLLHGKGAKVSYADPYVPEVHGREWSGRYDIKAVESHARLDRQYDCVVIVTDHKVFDYEAIVAEADLIVDTRNAIKKPYPHVFQPRRAAVGRRERRRRPVVAALWREPCTMRMHGHGSSLLVLGLRNRLRLPGLSAASRRVGAAGHAAVAQGAIRRHARTGRRFPSSSRRATKAARLPGRARQSPASSTTPAGAKIIVVSDGSTDGTAAALVAASTRRVRLIEVPAGGKPLALNAGVAAATGDILVFADARQRFCARRAGRARRELRRSAGRRRHR